MGIWRGRRGLLLMYGERLLRGWIVGKELDLFYTRVPFAMENWSRVKFWKELMV